MENFGLDNMRVNIPEMGFQNMDWIHLAQDWIQQRGQRTQQ
jgi:hypothetical protein